MSNPEDRRAHERYEMPLPCMISILEDNVGSKLIESRIKNISGGGIFLNGSSGGVVGATVKLDIVIPSRIVKSPDDGGTHISATGCVVRLEGGGMAVSFREDYRVSSLEQVLRFLDRKRAWLARQREAGLKRLQTNPSTEPDDNPIKNHKKNMDLPSDVLEDSDTNKGGEALQSITYALEA